MPYDRAFEFPRKRIHVQHILGEGEFGQVWLATAENIDKLNPRKSRVVSKGSIIRRLATKVWTISKNSSLVAVKRLKGILKFVNLI